MGGRGRSLIVTDSCEPLFHCDCYFFLPYDLFSQVWQFHFGIQLSSEVALPRYFGHSKYQSFVRIVNAWWVFIQHDGVVFSASLVFYNSCFFTFILVRGFRRVTDGPDRDSYYHEVGICTFVDFVVILVSFWMNVYNVQYPCIVASYLLRFPIWFTQIRCSFAANPNFMNAWSASLHVTARRR